MHFYHVHLINTSEEPMREVTKVIFLPLLDQQDFSPCCDAVPNQLACGPMTRCPCQNTYVHYAFSEK